MGRESSIRQESKNPDGKMSRAVHFPSIIRKIEAETASSRVSWDLTISHSLSNMFLIFASFMADKIMPLSDAVEGYDLFDGMKAQKVVFEAQN